MGPLSDTMRSSLDDSEGNRILSIVPTSGTWNTVRWNTLRRPSSLTELFVASLPRRYLRAVLFRRISSRVQPLNKKISHGQRKVGGLGAPTTRFRGYDIFISYARKDASL